MEAEDAVLSAGTTVEWVFGADDVEKVQGFAGFEFNADAQPYQSVMKTANKKLVSVPILNWEIRSGDLDESRGSFRKVAVALRHEEGGDEAERDQMWIQIYHDSWFLARCNVTKWSPQFKPVVECIEEKIKEQDTWLRLGQETGGEAQNARVGKRKGKKKRKVIVKDKTVYRFKDVRLHPLMMMVDSVGNWVIRVQLSLFCSVNEGNKFGKETNKLLGDLFLEKEPKYFMTHGEMSFKIQREFNRQTVAYSKSILEKGVELKESPELDVKLMPFQKESIHWMLKREGFYDSPLEPATTMDQLLHFLNEHVSFGYEYMMICNHFWNKFTGYILPVEEAWAIYHSWVQETKKRKQGRGLMADEMGLGKTIEILGLLTINKRDLSQESQKFVSHLNGKEVKRVKTNLIVCPESILQQWIDEVAIHVNGKNSDFKVFHYEGFVKMREKFRSKNCEEMVEILSEYDVVICSYTTMSSEVHYAEFSKNQRPSRTTTRKYDYTSPLSVMEFFRIILDEVQLSGSASSNVSRCANLLHRVHTWGVSGTPVSWYSDLQNILTYLQFHPFQIVNNIAYCVSANKNHLERYHEDPSYYHSYYVNLHPDEEWNGFQGCKLTENDVMNIFSKYDLAIRHTKEDVKDQIKIPRQINYMMPVEFNPIEQDHYLNLWHSFLSVSGFDSRGNGDCRLEYHELNHWLHLLRMTCCHATMSEWEHIDVSYQTWRETEELKDMDAILSSMKDEVSDKVRALRRENYSLNIQSGQVEMEIDEKFKDSIVTFNKVMNYISDDLEKFYDITDIFSSTSLGRTYEAKDLTNIRHLTQLLHQALFFLATSYYHIGSQRLESVDNKNEESAEKSVSRTEYTDVFTADEMKEIEDYKALEMQNYSLAEKLRREMLHERIVDVDAEIEKVKEWFSSGKPHRKLGLELIQPKKGDFGKILSGNYAFNNMLTLFSSMNEQIDHFNSLIEQLEEISYKGIVKDYEKEEDAEKAEEYEKSINDQDRAFSLLDMLERLLQNRDDMANSESFVSQFDPSISKVEITSSFHSNMLQNLKMLHGQSLKILLNEAEDNRNLKYMLANNKKYSLTTEQFINTYEIEITRITKENQYMRTVLKRFNDIYNAKTNYYSYLQRISDSLVPLSDLSKTARNEIIKNARDSTIYKQNEKKINNLQSRVRYLNTLSQLKDAIGKGENITCSICYSDIFTGSILKCGHYFCKDCITHWFEKNSSCPLCKNRMLTSDVYHFKFREEDQEETYDAPTEPVNKSGGNELSNVDTETIITRKYVKFPHISDVNQIEIENSWGGKVDQVIKLILYLKEQHLEKEPHKRSPQIVIYSLHYGFLDILSRLLTTHRIKFARSIRNTKFATAINNFKKNPDCTCLLLSVHSQATGLTLVNARHVFILDPILEDSTELQAISRVHRIGQNEETYVWNFMVRNTVEESIMKYKAVLEGRKKERQKELEDQGAEDVHDINGDFIIEHNYSDSKWQKHVWHSLFEHTI